MAEQSSVARKDERASPSSPKAMTPEPGLAVERLTHQDIPEICALYKRVWDPFKSELSPEILKTWEPTALEFTSWMEGVTYFAARREGKLIGAIGCAVQHGSCRLVHLAVDPEHRRRGVGSQLTLAAVEWAKHSNVPQVWVDALARFEEAAAMFRRLGFAHAGVLHRHFWREDINLFEKVL
ncbi:MAG: GNAT family N-acetyltransferase [Thermoplasmata archaeon]